MYLKPETLKLLEENIGCAPRDMGKGKDFLRLISSFYVGMLYLNVQLYARSGHQIPLGMTVSHYFAEN